jgi:hypothetical protein
MRKKSLFIISLMLFASFYLGLSATNFIEPLYFSCGFIICYIIMETIRKDYAFAQNKKEVKE